MAGANQARNPGRREALKKIALGGVSAGAASAFPILGQAGVTPAMARAAHMHPAGPEAAPDPDWKPLFLDAHENETVEALTDLIIPATQTPGAKAALVNRFIDLMLNDEDADRKKSFLQGLSWLDGRTMALYQKPFVGLTPDRQTVLLTSLANPDNKEPEDQPGVRFFEEIKDLTIFGYYTSKIGMEQELEYGGDDYHTEFPGACHHPEHLNGSEN
ncbi:MAG TPA: gluconate 2-dehydrogenase subunit 3 family protein [Terriglobia bacterium]|nr:gluconate 2-dehydrogenase subunit 3 family protein [Terriglobia bacterium]